MIILDTNVLSELMRPEPSETVLSWVNDHPTSSLFLTTITQAEILYGLLIMPEGNRQDALLLYAMDMFEEEFFGRIMPFDNSAASYYAEIVASRRGEGRPISQMDAQIAAIARSRGARIATRNIPDFLNCGVDLINPWEH